LEDFVCGESTKLEQLYSPDPRQTKYFETLAYVPETTRRSEPNTP
jgi:hypothetical protein